MVRTTSLIAMALALALTGCSSDPEKSGPGGAGGSGGTGGDGGTGGIGGTEDGVVRIEVSPDPDRICIDDCLHVEIDDTLLLVATAFDANDEPVDGIEFTWSSDDETIATVDADGVVTGISDGRVAITATAGARSGSVALQVGKTPIRMLQVYPVNADSAPAVLAGRWLQVTVAAYADTWGMTQVRGATIEWTSSPDTVEVRRGEDGEDGSTVFELRSDVVGAAVVTFTSPDADEGVEGAIEFTALDGAAAPGEVSFDRIAVGGDTACGVAGGALSCWGGNFAGQLGIGEEGPPEPFPMAVALADVVGVSAGQVSTCATTSSGAAYCWGANFQGILGVAEPDGPVDGSFAPMQVAGGHDFGSVAVGANHTCGLDGAGAAWCWGGNFSGELGLGPGADESSRIPSRVATDTAFAAIRPGGGYTCALDLEGKAWCWGGSHTAIGFDPGEGHVTVPVPTRVAGDRRFVAMDASFAHVCALDEDGAAWCWGDNASGQLGGDLPSSREPAKVAGDHAFVAIATGSFHTCALDADGAAWCWGTNQNGVLGDGGLLSSSEPVAVHGGRSFAAIAANGTTTCALEEDGVAWCWGSSASGQLGCGLVDTMRPLPVPVSAKAEVR